MVLLEEKKDLFTLTDEYALAHCISSDCRMGAGIAVEFKKRFALEVLQEYDKSMRRHPNCIAVVYRCRVILNLITKARYFDKPTYDSLRTSLEIARDLSRKQKITKIGMPYIGCGLDGLSWPKVREIIKEVFADTDLEIRVCYL